MGLVLAIDIIVVVALVGVAVAKGFEYVLPIAAFICILVPGTSAIALPGLFLLTTQRLVLIVLIPLYFMLGRRRPELTRFQNNSLKWLIIAQVTWGVISTINSIVPAMSIKKLLSEVVEYYVLYAVYVRTVTSIGTIYRILHAIVAAIVVCCIFGTIEAYWGWSIMSLFPTWQSQIGLALGITGGDEGRVASTFPHAILFGAALVIAITLGLHLAKVAKNGTRKALLWVAILLMFSNIYKSFSRGPWLGLILALSLLLLFEGNKLRKYLLIIASLVVLVLVIRPGVYESIRDLYSETFVVDWSNPKGLSYEYRYELRRVAQQALSRDFRHELWGYGMESFFSLHLEGELAGHRFPFLSCDSAWIELAVETGYVGLLLIALLLFKPAWLSWKDFRRIKKPDRYLSLTLLICMVSYYFMMTSVAMYAWGQEGYMLWILIAVSMVHRELKNPKSRVRPAEAEAITMDAIAIPCLKGVD